MARPNKNGGVTKATLWAIKLKRMGIKSLSEWARQNNYPVDTVITTVTRWGDRSDIPLGGFSREIIKKLREQTGMLNGQMKPVGE